MSDVSKPEERQAEAWTAPVIRSVVPVDRTRGGPFDKDDQDDMFYKLS